MPAQGYLATYEVFREDFIDEVLMKEELHINSHNDIEYEHP